MRTAQLYWPDGRLAAIIHERPVMPANLVRYSVHMGQCDSCTELTIREHCIAHWQCAPGDGLQLSGSGHPGGGEWMGWECRCIACTVAFAARCGLTAQAPSHPPRTPLP